MILLLPPADGIPRFWRGHEPTTKLLLSRLTIVNLFISPISVLGLCCE